MTVVMIETADSVLLASQVLRERTAAGHEAVDRVAEVVLRRGGGLRLFLTALREVIVPRERMLKSLSWPAGLREDLRFRKEEWLAADLGPSDAVSRIVSVSRPEAWGMLYVMEGSTLGATFIRRMDSSFETSRYLAGYGVDTGRMWTEFRTTLNAALRLPEDVSFAAAAACREFEAYEERLRFYG
jgi:heme oxygenase